MSELPPPSDTPRVRLHVGTLSGLDVLTVGTVAPGATVELKDGSMGEVLRVRGRRLTPRHGILPGEAVVLMKDGRELTVLSKQIAGVVREAPQQSSQSNGSSAAAVSGAGTN